MKTYETTKECLKENGEHAWYDVENNSGMSCLVLHADGHCPNNDPVKKCYHCPATKIYRRTVTENWIEV